VFSAIASYFVGICAATLSLTVVASDCDVWRIPRAAKPVQACGKMNLEQLQQRELLELNLRRDVA
jgi:hypothetical protein